MKKITPKLALIALLGLLPLQGYADESAKIKKPAKSHEGCLSWYRAPPTRRGPVQLTPRITMEFQGDADASNADVYPRAIWLIETALDKGDPAQDGLFRRTLRRINRSLKAARKPEITAPRLAELIRDANRALKFCKSTGSRQKLLGVYGIRKLILKELGADRDDSPLSDDEFPDKDELKPKFGGASKNLDESSSSESAPGSSGKDATSGN